MAPVVHLTSWRHCMRVFDLKTGAMKYPCPGRRVLPSLLVMDLLLGPGLQRRLDKSPSLKDRYNQVFIDIKNSGIIEEVIETEVSYPIFYLPHHSVIKKSSSTTKIRPVFDASAVGPNGISLNDCVETGLAIMPDLVGVLMQFRQCPVALTADITKAFLQIRLRREDKDVHRFLWDCNLVVRVMRFLRVSFGYRSSPFLLNATVRYYLATCDQTTVVQKLTDILYVDYWLSGANTLTEAQSSFTEARKVMIRADMSLAKRSSNSSSLTDKVLAKLGSKYIKGEHIKILRSKMDTQRR